LRALRKIWAPCELSQWISAAQLSWFGKEFLHSSELGDRPRHAFGSHELQQWSAYDAGNDCDSDSLSSHNKGACHIQRQKRVSRDPKSSYSLREMNRSFPTVLSIWVPTKDISIIVGARYFHSNLSSPSFSTNGCRVDQYQSYHFVIQRQRARVFPIGSR